MSDWVETSLGDLMALDVAAVPVEPTQEYDIVGVLNRGRGLLFRGALPGSETSYKTLNRIGPGQVIYSRLKAFEGAITVAPHGLHEVYASQEFPTFTCGPLLLPSYFQLLTTTSPLWDTLQNLSTGMGGRRERVKPVDFLTIRIEVPSLPEQRRIVDVMAAVDAQIEALARETSIARASVGPLIQSLVGANEDWSRQPLGAVGEFIRGKRFTKADYVDEGLGVIHYSHIHTHFGPVTREVAAHVAEGARPRLRLASPGDVVIAATSEDVAGLGKATVWLGVDDVAVHDDAQIFRHGLDPLFATFVFASPAFQAQKVQYAGGTKVTRISGADMAKIEVPIPPRETQALIGKALADVVGQAERTEAELESLRAFRSALLTALLSHEVEVPASYETLLGEVA